MLGKTSRTPGCLCFAALVLFAAVTPQAPALLADRVLDPAKYQSPRATVRTLLVSVEAAKENPAMIADAVVCLDLPPGANGEKLAGQLEAVLLANGVDTSKLPETTDEATYVVANTPEYHLALRRLDDGRWVFDRETLAEVPRMYAERQNALQGRPPEMLDPNLAAEFSSPRATFSTFFEAFARDDLEGAAECIDLRSVPYVARKEIGQEMAVKIKQILDRSRLVLLQELPGASTGDPYFAMREPEGVIELARQPSGERRGEWLFSRATVKSLERLHDKYAHQPPSKEVTAFKEFKMDAPFLGAPGAWLSVRTPDWLRRSLVDTRLVRVKLYQVLGLLLLVVTTVALYRLLPRLLAAPSRRVMRRYGLDQGSEGSAQRFRPIALFLCCLFVRFGVLLLGLDKAILVWALGVINPLVYVFLGWALFRVLDLIVAVTEARMVAAGRSVAATHMLLPVVSLAIKITIFVAVLFRVLDLFDWNVTALLTGLGIGGVAFALGAQDTIKNFFGSMTLIADRPFVVGDLIKVGANEGVVEVLGLRSARIRTADGTLLTIPNADLANQHIANHGASRLYGYRARLAVVYTTPPERLIAFRDGIRKLILEHPRTRKQGFEVYLLDLTTTAIEVLVQVYFDVPDRRSELEARDSLLQGILRVAESLGVDFAFPKGTAFAPRPQVEARPAPAPEAGSRLKDAVVPGR